LKRGGVLVRASKRAGELVTLRDLLDEVGSEACRYFFLTRSADSAIDFDLELAKQQSTDNPLYYVQYAHARIASILRNAEEQGVSSDGADTSVLTEEAELTLLRKMLELPELIENIARHLEPHHLPHYALELATAFHDFYERHRVLSRPDAPIDPGVTAARLKLTEAARYTLAKVLDLMGVSAPERM
jgi:arginyl-tRNA synthetase